MRSLTHARGRFLWQTVLLLLVVCSFRTLSMAQDPFHIRVHEYEPLNRGEFIAELHTNYVAKGTTTADQLHLAYEFTAGVTPSFAIGVIPLTARRPGNG